MKNEKQKFTLHNHSANKVYIIAEAGVNHNGDLLLAKKLVDAAISAGADCVKFQTFVATSTVTVNAQKANYQLAVTDRCESQLEMLKKLELQYEEHHEILKYCRQRGIDYLSTPYSFSDIKFLESIDVQAYKVASGQVVEPLFLDAVARTGKTIFLSTGMATLGEVDDAVRIIRTAENENIILLQCTTNYPSSPEDANLRTIPTMAAAFGTAMGYSDHTQSDTACLVAIGLGARVIEKHLTLDKTMLGPDHSSSADPAEFARLVGSIRVAELTLGTGRKEPCLIEAKNAQDMRRSIVAARKIRTGEVFSSDMLTCKRPGTGIRPVLLPELIGCVATCDIAEDELITWVMCGKRK